MVFPSLRILAVFPSAPSLSIQSRVGCLCCSVSVRVLTDLCFLAPKPPQSPSSFAAGESTQAAIASLIKPASRSRPSSQASTPVHVQISQTASPSALIQKVLSTRNSLFATENGTSISKLSDVRVIMLTFVGSSCSGCSSILSRQGE